MSSLNRYEVIGRLGQDPEVRHLENGSTVATFSVATSESWKDKTIGEKRETTEWHNVVLWRGLAEVAEKYLAKGAQVYISGKHQTRSYEKDGVTRYVSELVGRDMVMLGGKGSGSKPPAPTEEPDFVSGDSNSEQPIAPQPENDTTDDLPF
jgi:single-strand DNA-binding protein